MSFASLLILRIILGISEAAFSGVPFYLSFFYRREELAFRTGLFISAAPLATAFASSLAWLITWLAQTSDFIAPWRLLFLVEGFPSVLVAYYCWGHVADRPESAWFLSRKEKRHAMSRLKDSSSNKSVSDGSRFGESDGQSKSRSSIDLSEVLQTMKDPKSYLTAVSHTLSDNDECC
jgi:phosphatidylinositol 3,5-bisphosphate 5-phosphatase